MLIFSLCLMYNYYMRLVKINRDRILYSAFTTDQDLSQENSKCWFSTLNKIFKILKLDIKDLADNSIFRNNLIEFKLKSIPVGVSPLQLVNLHRNRRYFVIKLHTWFCLSYCLKTNIKFYSIYQYFMSINSFFNTYLFLDTAARLQ